MQERAWYDAHREAILRGGGLGEEVDVGGIDLFPYFSSSCYRGFGDDDHGFYKVYEALFQTLCEEDQTYSDEVLRYPPFGDSTAADDVWLSFYDFFSAYSTPRSYAWLDKYDTRQAENRRVARLMEKDNKKIRDAARKERNELIRQLAKFVRKRDRRVQQFNLRLEEKIAENTRKTEEKRKQHLEERAKMLEEAVEKQQGAFGMEAMESELLNLEQNYDSEEEEEENYCVACNKQLRNAKAYQSHLKQKKHLEQVKLLREAITEHDVAADLAEMGFDLTSESAMKEETEEQEEDLSQSESSFNQKAQKKARRNKKVREAPPEESLGVSAAHRGEGAQVTEVTNGDLDSGVGEDKESSSETQKKVKKSRRAKKNGPNANNQVERDQREGGSTELLCLVCNNVFGSKNKLFAHLKSSGHAVVADDSSQRMSARKKK